LSYIVVFILDWGLYNNVTNRILVYTILYTMIDTPYGEGGYMLRRGADVALGCLEVIIGFTFKVGTHTSLYCIPSQNSPSI
jgi:hypothetical protein